MAYGLTPEEVTHYEENGFVVVEDVFDRETMQDYKKLSIEICLASETPEENVKWNAMADDVEKQGEEALHAFWRPQTISEKFRALCEDPKLTDRLASILGPDVITFNGLLIYKKREIGLGFPYHQDLWYFRKNNEMVQSCAIWMALDDADEENGCLWVVPGSHKGPIFDHVEPDVEFKQNEFKEVLEARKMAEISVPMRSGSCLFFSGQLLHSSGENHTDRDRTCYVIHNASADTVFGSREGSLEYRATMRTRGGREPQFKQTRPA